MTTKEYWTRDREGGKVALGTHHRARRSRSLQSLVEAEKMMVKTEEAATKQARVRVQVIGSLVQIVVVGAGSREETEAAVEGEIAVVIVARAVGGTRMVIRAAGAVVSRPKSKLRITQQSRRSNSCY